MHEIEQRVVLCKELTIVSAAVLYRWMRSLYAHSNTLTSSLGFPRVVLVLIFIITLVLVCALA